MLGLVNLLVLPHTKHRAGDAPRQGELREVGFRSVRSQLPVRLVERIVAALGDDRGGGSGDDAVRGGAGMISSCVTEMAP